MRLTVTLPELEQGWSIQCGATERILDVNMMAMNREPIPIAPIKDHDHRIIAFVMPTGDSKPNSPTATTIAFKPVWCKTFTLCAAKKDSLLALIIQLQNGQFWIDRGGWKSCNLTLDGPGTDPKAVYRSQEVMGDLLATWPRPNLVLDAIAFFKEKILNLPSQAPA